LVRTILPVRRAADKTPRPGIHLDRQGADSGRRRLRRSRQLGSPAWPAILPATETDMTAWTLFASTRSPFARKVRIALHELGLADRVAIVPVATSPMKPAPEVLPHNPLGQVPTLVIDGGEALVDSTAILDFLSELPGGAFLLPHAGAARREAMRRLALADGMMDKAVRWLDERFQAQNDDTAARIAGFRAGIERTLDRLEAEPPAPADRFDAGDIALLSLLGYLDFRFPELPWRDGRPRLAAWSGKLVERPSVAATAFSAG
jgi:glutathione S-transferase